MPRDIVPLNRARSDLPGLCEEVRAKDGEKIITKNGTPCVALISLKLLNHYHDLEREHVHLILLREAVRGLADLKRRKTIRLTDLKARYGRYR